MCMAMGIIVITLIVLLKSNKREKLSSKNQIHSQTLGESIQSVIESLIYRNIDTRHELQARL